MFLNLILVRRHVTGGVFIGSEEIKIAELVLILSIFLVIFQQNQVAFLLHMDVPRVLSPSHRQDGQDELNRPNNTLADGLFAVHEVSGYLSKPNISQSAHTLHLIFLILFESHRVPRNSLHFLVQPVQFSNSLDLLHFHVLDLGDVLRQISLVDCLNISPVILDRQFFEFSLVLVVPSTQSSSLLLGECASAGKSVLPSFTHLDVLADVILVCHLCVALHHSELLLVLARWNRAEIAALYLRLVEFVEEGERDVLVLIMCKVPLDPFTLCQFEVLKQTQVDLHC